MSEVNPRVVVIPNHQEWELQALEQLCVHVGRGTAPSYVEHSGVRAIGQRCVSKTGFDPSFARPHSERAMGGALQAVDGDVLLNSTGTGTIGRSAVFRENGRFIVDGHVTALRPKEAKCSPVWLSAVLQSPWGQEHLERFCYAGSTNQVELSASALRVSEVPAPPYNEQSKIAEVLDTMDAAIRRTEAVVAKLKAMKQGLLHDLLTRGIDANGDLRPPQPEAPHLYKQTPLGWLPKEWDVTLLGDAAESIIDGPFGSNLKTAHYVDAPGVRVVRLQNIQDGYFDDSEKAFIRGIHAAKLARNEVIGGDVLIASLGDDGHPVGRSCLYPADFPPAINKADCFRFRGTAKCRNGYATLFLNGEFARRQARGFEQGVTMKRINLGNLRRIKISLPRPAEQMEIELRSAAINTTCEATERELAKLRLQKSGLMEDLLTGRVPAAPLL